MRPFPHRTGLLNKHGPIRTGKNLRRRMSVKGAIKKTRSIAVERKQFVPLKNSRWNGFHVLTVCWLYVF